MPSRAIANNAEKAVQSYYMSLGYVTDRARPQAQTVAGGRTIFLAYDFLSAFDVIGIGPLGVLFSQITMAESNLSKKRRVIESFPWPAFTSQAECAFILAEVVYAERVAHPAGGNRKCWRLTFMPYDLLEKSWERRGAATRRVLWDDKEMKVLPQAMLS